METKLILAKLSLLNTPSTPLNCFSFSPKTLKSSKPQFSKTLVQSVLQWNRKPQLTGEIPRLVVITSGKGGFSKTTTIANVGLSLAHFGFSVVAIDADVSLRHLDERPLTTAKFAGSTKMVVSGV